MIALGAGESPTTEAANGCICMSENKLDMFITEDHELLCSLVRSV